MRGQTKTLASLLLTLALCTLVLSASGCVVVRSGDEAARPTPPPSYYETPDTGARGAAGSALSQVLSATNTNPAEDTEQRRDGRRLALVSGEVVYVVDGDTAHIKLETGKIEKVRFIGVDTPESTIEYEPYGKEAASYTRAKLLHRTVFVETDVSQRDRYGRLLAYIWLDRPTDDNGGVSHADVARLMFNSWLVADGYAQMMTIPPNVKYVDDFRALERFARERNRGLWDPKLLTRARTVTDAGEQENYTGGTNPTKAVGKVIGNCNSLKFHRPDCPAARKIATSHRLAFSGRAEAKAAGYRPCKICRP